MKGAPGRGGGVNKGVEGAWVWLILRETRVWCCWWKGEDPVVKQAGEAGRSQGAWAHPVVLGEPCGGLKQRNDMTPLARLVFCPSPCGPRGREVVDILKACVQ